MWSSRSGALRTADDSAGSNTLLSVIHIQISFIHLVAAGPGRFCFWSTSSTSPNSLGRSLSSSLWSIDDGEEAQEAVDVDDGPPRKHFLF